MNNNTNNPQDIQASGLKEENINLVDALAAKLGVEPPVVNYADIDPQLNETNNWLALQNRKLALILDAASK